MSITVPLRRPRVRLSESISTSKRRPRVRLNPPTEEDLIAEHIRTKGITYCPSAAVETVRNLYSRRTEDDRLRKLEVQAEKDPDRIQKLKEHRMRILKKTEMWVQLLQREGKPIPKELSALALRQS
jgi:hypothetical protein